MEGTKMISSTSANSFILCDHIVEPVRKRFPDDDEMESMARLILTRSLEGWEIVDGCGDEVRQTVLVFRKVRDPRIIPRYTIETLEVPAGTDELTALNERLWQRLAENWLPTCIADSLISKPVIVYRKSYESCSNMQVKLVTVPIGLFEHTATSLEHELVTQQVKNNLTLQCVVHGGLSPTLVLVSKQNDMPYQYAVEHAFGGVFNNKKTLTEIIENRTYNGWEACGMFEDAFISPCVIFRRALQQMPLWNE
jgi:hypothetical protein